MLLLEAWHTVPAVDETSPHGVGEAVRRAVYQEDWWLDAATNGAWGKVCVERGGRVVGWLPYANDSHMGFLRCGLPPLTRLLYPVLSVTAPKIETLRRARFQIETELIDALPRASCYEFVLPPDQCNALAWQAAGFDARIQHTFVIQPNASVSDCWQQMNSKTRNLVRRSQDSLVVRPLDASEFVAQYRLDPHASVDADHTACVARLTAAAVEHERGRAVGAVDAAGRVHASVLFVWDDVDYYYFLSTRNGEFALLGAVAMLVWDGISDAISRGLRFDFDGVSSASRMKFLQSFGGNLSSRVVVTRATTAYEARLLLRRLHHRILARGFTERFF